MRIWIRLQFEWSGFVVVAGSDVNIIRLPHSSIKTIANANPFSGSRTEWTHSLNLIRIRIRIRRIEYGLILRVFC